MVFAAKRSDVVRALILGLLCCACSSGGVSAEGKLCASDMDCTGGWHPGLDSCGSTDRCMDGVCGVPAALSGDVSARGGDLTLENGQTIYLEIVSSPFETARGMMCRTHMAPGFGMWFIEKTQKPHNFWMKNTLIPLDMVFVNEDWMVVGVVENAEPKSLQSRGVLEASRYVLELPAGGAAEYAIKVGSRVRFTRHP